MTEIEYHVKRYSFIEQYDLWHPHRCLPYTTTPTPVVSVEL